MHKKSEHISKPFHCLCWYSPMPALPRTIPLRIQFEWCRVTSDTSSILLDSRFLRRRNLPCHSSWVRIHCARHWAIHLSYWALISTIPCWFFGYRSERKVSLGLSESTREAYSSLSYLFGQRWNRSVLIRSYLASGKMWPENRTKFLSSLYMQRIHYMDSSKVELFRFYHHIS